MPVQEGVLESGAWKVTAGGALNVSVAASTGTGALVKGDNIAAQGLYYVAPHTAAIVETITTAHATLPRIDQVILEVLDATHDGGASNTVRTRIVDGVATAAATLDNRNGAAALPNNALRLADVLVPAASVTVLAANVRDRRPWTRCAYRHVVRSTSNYTTTSASLVEIDTTNLRVRLECSGGPVRIQMFGLVSASTGPVAASFGVFMDGVGINSTVQLEQVTLPASGANMPVCINYLATPVAGSHVFSPTFSTSAGTLTLSAVAGNPLTFVIEELDRPNADNT